MKRKEILSLSNNKHVNEDEYNQFNNIFISQSYTNLRNVIITKSINILDGKTPFDVLLSQEKFHTSA